MGKKFGYPRCSVCSHEGRWSCLACYKCSARGWVSVIGVFIEWKAITKWIAIFCYLPLCSSYLENWEKIVEILCPSFCIVTWQSQNRRIYFVPFFLSSCWIKLFFSLSIVDPLPMNLSFDMFAGWWYPDMTRNQFPLNPYDGKKGLERSVTDSPKSRFLALIFCSATLSTATLSMLIETLLPGSVLYLTCNNYSARGLWSHWLLNGSHH